MTRARARNKAQVTRLAVYISRNFNSIFDLSILTSVEYEESVKHCHIETEILASNENAVISSLKRHRRNGKAREKAKKRKESASVAIK